MVAAMTDAAGQAGVEVDALTGIGVGSPGDVDGERGTVTSARNLPDWEGEFALGAALEQALGTRTRLASDVGGARLRACMCAKGSSVATLAPAAAMQSEEQRGARVEVRMTTARAMARGYCSSSMAVASAGLYGTPALTRRQ